MDWKDTVIKTIQCVCEGKVFDELKDTKKDSLTFSLIKAQAEISFKAGIKEVVEWVEMQPEEDCVECGYLRLIDRRDWQAFLKKKGIK